MTESIQKQYEYFINSAASLEEVERFEKRIIKYLTKILDESK